MNKSLTKSKQLNPYKKKIKNYNISYCSNEFVAKTMFG